MSKRTRQDPVLIVYIISFMPSRWITFEWIAEHLDRRKFALSFIFLHNGEPPLIPFLRAHKVPVLHIQYSGKCVLPRAIRIIYTYLRDYSIDIIHTHFRLACLCGLPAAVLARVPVRIHTRHYGRLHPHDESTAWVRVYSWLNNSCSTRIIAPSDTVKSALREVERVQPDKIIRIDHGFDLELYGASTPERANRHRTTRRRCTGDWRCGKI